MSWIFFLLLLLMRTMLNTYNGDKGCSTVGPMLEPCSARLLRSSLFMSDETPCGAA